MDWFDRDFKDNLGLRYNTVKKALELFAENNGELIVETGTTRLANDWGGGYSTVVFGEFLRRYEKGKLITIDIDERNIAFCKDVTALYARQTEYVVSDSLEYLKSFGQKIDLLYLDSYDYPYGELLELYGGQVDIENARKLLSELREEEIVEKHFDVINPSQEHQLKEFKLVEHLLPKGTPILLDDSDLPGGGKTRLTKLYLKEIGATCVIDAYQSLWIL